MWVRSLGREDPLEEEMANHSSILVWEIPQREEPGGLQSMTLQKSGHNLMTKQQLSPFSSHSPYDCNHRIILEVFYHVSLHE